MRVIVVHLVPLQSSAPLRVHACALASYTVCMQATLCLVLPRLSDQTRAIITALDLGINVLMLDMDVSPMRQALQLEEQLQHVDLT